MERLFTHILSAHFPLPSSFLPSPLLKPSPPPLSSPPFKLQSHSCLLAQQPLALHNTPPSTFPMARTLIAAGLFLVVVTMLWPAIAAQSSCTNVLISLSPCLNYISGNSSTPSSGCCSQLGSVVRSQPQCLCQVLNGGGSSLGININQTQALALPGACNVQTPPLSRCNSG